MANPSGVSSDYELILAIFNSEERASIALDDLKQAEENGTLRLFNAALLSKDEAGRTFVKEDQDLSPGAGSVFGAVVGGLIGLLGGPAGLLVGAAAGAATGGLAAKRADLGFDDHFLAQVTAALQPGTSVLLLLAESRFSGAISASLERQDSRLLRHLLRSEVIDRLRGSSEE